MRRMKWRTAVKAASCNMKWISMLTACCILSVGAAAAEEGSVSGNDPVKVDASQEATEGMPSDVESLEMAEETVSDSESEKTAEVATAGEMAQIQEVVQDWMVPVYPEELKDGVYEIQVESSSSMFQVEECVLTVEGDEMSALMTMSAKGYLKLYMGSGEDAVKASEEEYIPYVEAEDGRHTYEVPVSALDYGISCTAFSKNREKWYDRTLVFLSASLPFDVFETPPYTAPEDLALEDGTYTVEASLSGSGKASVESPTEIYAEGGKVWAKVVFGSSNYDYVAVDGEKYTLLNEEGNSAFLIPVVGFDYALPIIADSTALGTPRELSYMMYFDSSTIQKAEIN